jgi:3-methylcrotonyl-CoA carboxylase beta subunit
MGGEQASSVLRAISRDVDEAELTATRERYERESSALFATARLWDDGIVAPTRTRDTLGLALRIVRDVPTAPPGRRYGIFRM